MTSSTRSFPGCTTPSSTPSARRRIAGSGSRARICPAPWRPPSSSPGTTATPTSRTSRSTSRDERAVVIGNGNVALDVARMLALTREELESTDTTDPAIEAIVGSGIREILVVGPPRAGAGSVDAGRGGRARRARRRRHRRRSGRSSSSIRQARPSSRRRRRPFGGTSSTYGSSQPRPRRASRARSGCASSASPVAILGEERVEGIELVRNELVDGRARPDRRARDDSLRDRLPQRRLPRRRAAGRAVRRALAGRSRTTRRPRRAPGLYCAGWIKRGPSGVIGTNKKDADRDGGAAARGRASRALCRARGEETLEALLAGARRRRGHVRRLGGDRPAERTRRRAARPPARQALQLGRAARARRAS